MTNRRTKHPATVALFHRAHPNEAHEIVGRAIKRFCNQQPTLFEEGSEGSMNTEYNGIDLSKFEPIDADGGTKGKKVYVDESKIYVAPPGYIYLARSLYDAVGSPAAVSFRQDGDYYALWPGNEGYKVLVDKNSDSAVRISCRNVLANIGLVVANFIVSYDIIRVRNVILIPKKLKPEFVKPHKAKPRLSAPRSTNRDKK